MSEVKLPTVGRIVHYFPVSTNYLKDKEIIGANLAEMLPALVIQVFGSALNLQVFTMNPDAKNVLRYSVPHLSYVTKNENGEPQMSYWDWPEIK